MTVMNDINHNICIASYPRSGNTFMRNIFMDVFSLFSWNNYTRYCYLREALNHPGIRARDHFFLNEKMYSPEELRPLVMSQIIKTHELPEENAALLETGPFVICIIRDGRDAVISEAHHRKDIIEQGSSFRNNLREAILAEGGSHFGGWSENVCAWSARADLIMHFEQLITDPERCIRKLMSMVTLPTPDWKKMPTFKSQRSGHSAFITNTRGESYRDAFPKLFFRQGKAGAWRDEMPGEMLNLFMEQHGDLIHDLGYDQPEIMKLKYAI